MMKRKKTIKILMKKKKKRMRKMKMILIDVSIRETLMKTILKEFNMRSALI